MNYFLHSAGPIAANTRLLGWIFAGICVAVCLIIAGLLAYAVVHRRQQRVTSGTDASGTDASESDSSIDRSGSGLHAVAIGTAISTVILVGMAIYSLIILEQIAHPSSPIALTLKVTGYDWWWRVDYDDGANSAANVSKHFTTANEIHIPTGVPVRLLLNSADVIHAFWVPQLAGKTQMIPGLTNEQWLQADQPGVYRGQCTQYCGAQHAHMAVEVVAQPPADFARWQTAQRLPISVQPAQPALLSAGHRLFSERCAGCHAVRGTDANGISGPDLTHLNARRMLAAGVLTNTPAHQLDWITRAQTFKPGSRMPSMPLDSAEQQAMSAFLAVLN
jgi:cytochrome c oxidase subunit 2